MRVLGPGPVELAVATNFSFLRGASHAEELVVQAARLGLAGLAVADRNSVAGLVRAHMAAKEVALPFVAGCRLVFQDTTPDVLVWPRNRRGWQSLCELLSLGKRRAPKGECHLTRKDLLRNCDALLMAVVPDRRGGRLGPLLKALKAARPGAVHLALVRGFGPGDQRRMAALAGVAPILIQTPMVTRSRILQKQRSVSTRTMRLMLCWMLIKTASATSRNTRTVVK